jgi:hypothetical protein
MRTQLLTGLIAQLQTWPSNEISNFSGAVHKEEAWSREA